MIESVGLSQVGTVREDNQDAIRLSPYDHAQAAQRGYLYAVADGMGGYAHGGLASNLALETFFQAFYGEGGAPPDRLRQGVAQANLSVYQAAQRLGGTRMGTTLTAASIRGRKLHLAHVGDSRAYLVRDRRATCLTHDHTQVGELVRMKVLTPAQVRAHAQRSILNRCLGLSLFVQPELSQLALHEEDRLVLCSDGVWAVIEDDEFARLAEQATRAEELSRQLIDLALDRHSDDNVSVIVVVVHGFATPRPAPRRWWPVLFPNLRRSL